MNTYFSLRRFIKAAIFNHHGHKQNVEKCVRRSSCSAVSSSFPSSLGRHALGPPPTPQWQLQRLLPVR